MTMRLDLSCHFARPLPYLLPGKSSHVRAPLLLKNKTQNHRLVGHSTQPGMSSRGGRRRHNGGRAQNNGDMAVDEPQNNQNNQNNQLKVPHVEVRNWEGGTMADLVSFLERKTRSKIQNVRQNGPVISAQIPPNDAREIERWSGVRFAGNKLNIKVVYKTVSASPETSMTFQVLHGFLQSRYDPQAKLLNLTMMMSDPTLQAHEMLSTPERAVKVFQALMKVAGENYPGVESISLEGNSLADANLVSSIAQTYPSLLNLSLANNQISSIATFAKLKNQLPRLRELVLAGNPVLQHPAFQSQARELVAMFPRLLLIDGVPVRNEADLPKNSLPAPIMPTFFEDEGVASLVPVFLTNFFELWDKNRPGLMALYDQASTFSLCYNGGAPHLPTSKPAPATYIQMSRNLVKNGGQQARHNKVYIGQGAIASAFSRAPASKHNLGNAPAFAIDAWKISDVRGPGDTAIMMVVHGEFEESTSTQLRSFDRTLVVLPGMNGSYLVASDMLNIRLQSTLPISAPPNNVASGISSAQAPVPGAQLNTPSGGENAALLQEFMKQTRLTAEYADMCLKQANYDPPTAYQLFQQSQGQLPANAFQ